MVTRDRLALVYDYQHDRSTQEWSLNALGIGPLSIYRHSSTPAATRDRFFPLYSYQSGIGSQTSRLTMLGFPRWSGFPTLALYEHVTSPTQTADRFVPLYRYARDHQKNETSLGALLLFHAKATPTETRHSVFPVYSYANDRAKGERRVGVGGYAPFSLYQHVSGPTRVADRVFPLYAYSYERPTREGRFAVLWPLASYKSRDGRTTEASLLWWLVNYERPDDAHHEFRILGGSAMAVFRRQVTPERSVVEFNPILPLYYQRREPAGTTWNVFGGLVGREVGADGRERMRWLWVL